MRNEHLQNTNFLSSLEKAKAAITNPLANPAVSLFLREVEKLQTSGVLPQIEQRKAILEKLQSVPRYESLSEDARRGFDIATDRTRIELKPIQPKVKVMSIPEQIERLEKLVERVEKLNENIIGETYAENNYEN